MLDIQHPLGVGFVLRLDMWSRALAMIRDLPLTGVGLNTFPLALTHFYPGLHVGPEPHAHNLLLQTAVDLGLPGLLALTWLFAAFFFLTREAYGHSDRPWQRGLLLGVAGGLLSYVAGGLLDVVTLGAKPIAGLWLMLGVGAAAWRLLREEDGLGPAPRAWRRATYAMGALLLATTALGGALAPGQPARNLGSLRAHRALITVRQTGQLPAEEASSAINALEQALSSRPRDAQLHGLLAGLHAWQGNQAAALAHLQRRLALDGPQALARYAPFVRWERRLRGRTPLPPWHGTVQLYRHWRNRQPGRAEPCLLLALAVKRRDGQEAAEAIVRRCRHGGATPAALLSHYLAHPPRPTALHFSPRRDPLQPSTIRPYNFRRKVPSRIIDSTVWPPSIAYWDADWDADMPNHHNIDWSRSISECFQIVGNCQQFC